MTWDIRCRGWEDFPTPQKWFAVGEALAHLEYLMDRGQVGRPVGRGVLALSCYIIGNRAHSASQTFIITFR